MAMPDRFALLQQRRYQLERLSRSEFQQWARARRSEIARHHYFSQANGSYRVLVGARVPRFETDWSELPIIDKHYIAQADYSTCPSYQGRIVQTSTSGTTSSAITLPQTTSAARIGLGDNFLRALMHAGATSTHRHWGIEHWMRRGVATGSQLSMRWLRKCLGANALVTRTHDPIDEQIIKAADFRPWSISSSPGFLLRLASRAKSEGHLRPSTVLFGGAALDSAARDYIQANLQPEQIVGFFATADAGALGVDTRGDGIYTTFSESHWIEILDEGGDHVAEGEQGSLVVTFYENQAAPIIRYRVGDLVQFCGWESNRLLLSAIRRHGDASIGSTLLPLADLADWTARVHSVDPNVMAVQLVRRPAANGFDQPVIRVVAESLSSRTRLVLLGLLTDFPQLMHEMATGEVLPVEVERVSPQHALEGVFKLSPYVDERIGQARAPRSLV